MYTILGIGYTFWSSGHRGQIDLSGNVSGYYQWCVLLPQTNGKNLLLKITHTDVIEHVEIDTSPSLICVHGADRYYTQGILVEKKSSLFPSFKYY